MNKEHFTNNDAQELSDLFSLQKRRDRPMRQEEQDRMIELRSRMYHLHCLNPICPGGYYELKTNCPICERELYVSKYV